MFCFLYHATKTVLEYMTLCNSVGQLRTIQAPSSSSTWRILLVANRCSNTLASLNRQVSVTINLIKPLIRFPPPFIVIALNLVAGLVLIIDEGKTLED